MVRRVCDIFKRGDASLKLIYINVFVFLIVNLFSILYQLFDVSFQLPINWFAMSDDVSLLLMRPWVSFTYMFLHMDVFHIFFNMMTFYWFGKIYLMFYSERQLVGLYFLGGFFGAILFVVFYNLFPLFLRSGASSVLIGASASVVAVIVATALKAPNMLMRLFLFGNVKLKYIALIMVVVSFYSITSENAGGNIAHLGGALAGFLFIVSLRKKIDLTVWVDFLMDRFFVFFRPSRLKVKRGGFSQSTTKMSDGDYNAMKAQRMKDIDHILDKIKTSGYESLTEEEKKRLFN